MLLGVLCLAALRRRCGGGSPAATIAEERILGPAVLPSPAETFGDFHSLWFEHALTRNTLMSLQRVVLGFGLAALVGIPAGRAVRLLPPRQRLLRPA